jgi:MarR family transcriptional regulator, transcriptional regulator for hemolysin
MTRRSAARGLANCTLRVRPLNDPMADPTDDPMIDQLLAEPVVRQIVCRGQIDKATICLSPQQAAATPQASCAKCDPVTHAPDTIVRLLLETARLWSNRYDREVRAQLPGMSGARCNVLIHLLRQGGVNQAALARSLDIRPITLTRVLDRLEADGFVSRLADPADRRAHILALTAKALPIIEHIQDLNRKIHDELRLGMSKAMAGRLLAILWRMRMDLAGSQSDD